LLIILSSVYVLKANAHDGSLFKAPWEACADKELAENCSFTNANNDLYKGSCQLMSDALMCVRNQPIEKNATEANNDAHGSDHHHN